MIDINTLNEDVTIPRLCQDADDFHKLLLGTIASAEDQPVEALTIGLRVLLHEYFALVVQGKLLPYEQDAAPDDTVAAFRSTILSVTENAQQLGMPLKEENGKMVFNHEEILRRREQDD